MLFSIQGDREGQTKFRANLTEWSGFRTDDYGWTNMFFVNGTHMHLQEVSIDKVYISSFSG